MAQDTQVATREAFSLSKPTDVVTELFDPDEAVKRDFQNNTSAQVMEFAEVFARAYALFESFSKDCQYSVQAALVGGLMHGVLDDTLTAVKLMLTGKLSVTGNLARQSVEGLCMAIMCAQSKTLYIGEREQSYWQLLRGDDKAVQAQRAPRQLIANLDRMGLNKEGADQLRAAVEAHHQHSHAGILAMANRMDLSPGGMIYFGGHYDPEKLKGYIAELTQLTSICKWAEETMGVLWPVIKALPRDPIADSAHSADPPSA